MIQKFPDNKSLICYPGNSHQIWIKRIFSIQSFERICLLNIFKSLTTSWGTRPPVQKETKWKKDIKRLIHKFYPKMNGSCLGVQLHWHPIRFKISWVLQLSHRFHRTMLVKFHLPRHWLQHLSCLSLFRMNPQAGKEVKGLVLPRIFHFCQIFYHLSFPHGREESWLKVVSIILVLGEQTNGLSMAQKSAGSTEHELWKSAAALHPQTSVWSLHPPCSVQD